MPGQATLQEPAPAGALVTPDGRVAGPNDPILGLALTPDLQQVQVRRESERLRKWEQRDHKRREAANARRNLGVIGGPLLIAVAVITVLEGGWGFLWGPLCAWGGIAWLRAAVRNLKAGNAYHAPPPQ